MKTVDVIYLVRTNNLTVCGWSGENFYSDNGRIIAAVPHSVILTNNEENKFHAFTNENVAKNIADFIGPEAKVIPFKS